MSAAAGLPSFDPETYIQQILRAFRSAPDDELPPLLERYALDHRFAEAADPDIRGWINQVVDLWRRQVETSTGLGRICQRLLEADDELHRNGTYDNPQWWRAQIGAYWSAGSGPPQTSPATADGQPATDAQFVVGGQLPTASSAPAAPSPPIELPRPIGLEAEMLDDCVMLRWEEPPGMPDGVIFTVERLVGPGIKRIRPVSSRVSAQDREPPAGSPLTYRVIAEHAETGGRSDSQPVEVVFAPPVTDLAARQTHDGGVRGRWSAHPDLGEARVWRTAEGPSADQAEDVLIQTHGNGFEDLQAPVGHHIYNVQPLYRDPVSGQIYEGRRAAVPVSVVPPPPPPRLTQHEIDESGSAAITVRWSKLPADTTLLLRRAAVEPPGAPEDLLMLEDAEVVGEPVANGLIGTTALVKLPAGRWVLVPFAVAGDRAVRGDSIKIDVAPPMDSLEVIRTGPDVFVSWVWPNGLRLARIIWRANGVDLSREVTYNEFQRQGGVTFSRSEAATVQVRGIVRRGGSDVLECMPAIAEVPAQSPTLTYHVHGVRRFFGLLPWHGRRRVVLVTDLPCTCVSAEIYVHLPGDTPESDIILHAANSLDLGPDKSREVTVVLPSTGERDRPYYVSCRASTASGAIRVDHFASSGREVR